jgi:hypothetical protein
VTVLAIKDLAMLLEPPIPEAAEHLRVAWEVEFETINLEDSKRAVEMKLNNLRDLTLEMIENLD